MAKSISDEELQLRKRARRRLIGAIALVTLIAVGLPMVLDTEPKPVGQNVEIQIPSSDTGSFASKVVPVAPPQPGPAPKAAAPAESPKPAISKPAPQSQPPSAAQAPDAAPAAASKARPAPPEKPKAAAVAGDKGFMIRVAALADAEKAKQLQARLSDNGIKSYAQTVKTVKGDVTRVRAGPFAAREDAERAREKLQAMGLNGAVAPQ